MKIDSHPQSFHDIDDPTIMITVGNPGDEGGVEISDLLFTARGPTAGLVAMQWNIKADAAGRAAMWGKPSHQDERTHPYLVPPTYLDVYSRLSLPYRWCLWDRSQTANCPKLSGQVRPECIAGALLLYISNDSSAYLDNVWAW